VHCDSPGKTLRDLATLDQNGQFVWMQLETDTWKWPDGAVEVLGIVEANVHHVGVHAVDDIKGSFNDAF
jgi:hypothetical protein